MAGRVKTIVFFFLLAGTIILAYKGISKANISLKAQEARVEIKLAKLAELEKVTVAAKSLGKQLEQLEEAKNKDPAEDKAYYHLEFGALYQIIGNLRCIEDVENTDDLESIGNSTIPENTEAILKYTEAIETAKEYFYKAHQAVYNTKPAKRTEEQWLIIIQATDAIVECGDSWMRSAAANYRTSAIRAGVSEAVVERL